ncbi:hypothetical protein GNX18_16805 [Microbulbifer sp. SH-1]|uniref:glycosyl hydrolase n=1 Tax=Microbulbifer sp. SH-1 TaxID=2681547 RepID=UPI00140E2A3C|nr:glycosyl hydrolase [Microbulbifer sp. SH-1]QIL91258.1 hypothetical protein GNX18_16805 [Microbulbifer sp. SH-1]
MFNPKLIYAGLVSVSLCIDAAFAQGLDPKVFMEPPSIYRPTITIDEGAGYNAPLEQAAERAIKDLQAGGILVSPQGDPERKKPFDFATLSKLRVGLLDEYPEHASPWLPKALPGEARFGSYLNDGNAGPGKPPSLGYMTPEWFSTIDKILDDTKSNDLYAIYYDEAGFPSGSADGTIPPEYYRKVLHRQELTVSGGQPYSSELDPETKTLALIATDTSTGERVDLLATAENKKVSWVAPPGNWRVQHYYVATSSAKGTSPDYYGTADYLDPEATKWFINASYNRAHEGFSDHFGSTIKYTFFDDVGIFNDEKTWHPSIDERFKEITGKPAAKYYPALWEDIGPETAAARVGFFKARSEILGETFPKLITDWAHEHGVKSTGHAPGNYDLQPTDTIGDPFKFYAYTDVPMADVLWGVGFARGGFKLISSVSAERDLPLTAAEAFSVNNDANGYRRMIELYIRGFNHFITGARQPSTPISTPAEFNRWAGRSSYLLQGGRHVADIAILFPIESLQAFYAFNAKEHSADLPSGTFAYQNADYQAIGEMLVSQLHRDFTFIHPDTLASDKIKVEGKSLEMKNRVNNEKYRALILPGGDVISADTLLKIKEFWNNGGTVVATSQLPSRSAEFGRDSEIQSLVSEIFGSSPSSKINLNSSGGKSAFLEKPDPVSIEKVLGQAGITPDVAFSNKPIPKSGNGQFGYIHRQREGNDIYYFGNSSDETVETTVKLRGQFKALSLWNPHNGTSVPVKKSRRVKHNGEIYTEVSLSIPGVSSMAIIGSQG